MGHECSAK